MRVKRWWAGLAVLAVCLLVGGAIGGKKVIEHNKIETYAMEPVDTVSVGRGSVGVFDHYSVEGYGASYDDVYMVGNAAMSEPSFTAWVDNRWKEIEKKDARQAPEHLPTIHRVSPHAVWFKFNYLEVDDKPSKLTAYKGEGAVWMDNKAIFLAPSGKFDADTKIPKMIGRLRERLPEHKDTGLCADFFCLEMPPAKSESASVNISFPGIDGLTLLVQIESYATEQEKLPSQRGGIALFPQYAIVDTLKGETVLTGGYDKAANGRYYTSITSQWYYPGTSGNPNDPSVRISLTYEYDAEHKPSTNGWFDDETVKKTGFTPEKFMSMWEATLKSFKRQR